MSKLDKVDIVHNIIGKYYRTSTDWFERAKAEVTSLHDPEMTAIFEWSVI